MTGYALCATPRSGSTLLCSLLRSSGVAGAPQSLFRAEDRQDFARDWGIARADGGFDWADYLRAARVAGRGGTPVFAVRLMWETLRDVEGLLGGATLEQALGPLRFVHLFRRDLVAQAVSLHRALHSGVWHLGIEEAAVPGVPRYDFTAIDGHVRAAEAANAGWTRWFAARGIVPLRVAYEDLAADPVATAQAVLVHVGVTAAGPLHAPNRRMADAESAVWIARYRDEAGV